MKKVDEKVLAVQRSLLFDIIPQGFVVTDLGVFEQKIMKSKEFLWRSSVETDFVYKQIIPYLIFTYNNRFFLMKRRDTTTESRLKNCYSLGIGGHIREDDIVEGAANSIADWAMREFIEEIKYPGTLKISSMGILNDESDEVGQVHTGFVFLLEGSTDQISIKDEHEWGGLVTLQEAQAHYHQMEKWSQMVFDFLLTK
jgi:predicted NUDIX family phosphoesterase